LEYFPVQGFAVEEMGKQMSQVSDLVGLFLEDVVVSVEEGLNEKFLIFFINRAESLGQEAEEGLIDPFHHTALQNHVNKLVLIALGNVQLQNFVSTLFEVNG